MNKEKLIQLVQDYLEIYPSDIHGENVLDFLNKYDNFWQRTNESGHITASAWVINHERSKALLTHHIGLDKWFQLGGHIESADADIYDASLRELIEESGSNNYKLISNNIFDIDVHQIPVSKKGVPAHVHYDIRMLYEGNSEDKILFDSNESMDVVWLTFEEIKSKTQEWSVLRMIEKTMFR